MAACVAAYVGSECFHKRFQEADRHAVGVEVDVKRLVHREYLARYSAFALVEPGDVGVERECAGIIVPAGLYVGIADGAPVVPYGINVKARAVELGCLGKDIAGGEAPGGAPPYHGLVDFKGFKYREEGYRAEVYNKAVGRIFACESVDGYGLASGIEAEAFHFRHIAVERDGRRFDGPGFIAEVHGAGVEMHR